MPESTFGVTRICSAISIASHMPAIHIRTLRTFINGLVFFWFDASAFIFISSVIL